MAKKSQYSINESTLKKSDSKGKETHFIGGMGFFLSYSTGGSMETKPMTLPMVPLRGMVVFPKVVTQLDIGRTTSVQAVKAAMDKDQYLVVSTQKDESIESPTLEELGRVGTIVKINQMLRLPGGVVRILVEGVTRVNIDTILSTEPFYEAVVTP